MVIVQDGLEAAFEEYLVHSCGQGVCREYVEVVLHHIGIAVISRHDCEAGTLRESVAPLKGHVRIGITESGVTVEGESVTRPIGVCLDGVAGVDPMGN